MVGWEKNVKMAYMQIDWSIGQDEPINLNTYMMIDWSYRRSIGEKQHSTTFMRFLFGTS